MKNLLRAPLRRLLRNIGMDVLHHDDSSAVRLADEIRECIRLDPTYRHNHAGRLGWGMYLTDLVKDLMIDGIIDVGANKGQFHDSVRKLGIRQVMHSFEPIPELAGNLAASVLTDPAWTVHAHAAGARMQTLLLHVLADDALSSLHRPNAEATAVWSEAKTRLVREIEVPVRPLAGFFEASGPGSGLSRVLLKTDTQGADLVVLIGCEPTLDRIQAVQFEAAVRPAYVGACVYGDVVAWLEARGFVLGGLFPIHHEGLRLVEFDCIMIRPPAR